jgi:hypothetical protein
MKLVLEEQTSWPVITADKIGNLEGVQVVVGSLDPSKDIWKPWKQRALNLGIPKGGKVDVVKETPGNSTLGWSIETIESVVLDASGKTVEARITVLYFLLEWYSFVVVRAQPDKLAAERDRALTLLHSARPDWSRPEVAAIAQLYD